MIAIMEAESRVEAPFGEWLMRKLREREMSLSDVARLAQCDYTYLWRLVNVGRARGRQYRRPSYDMAERVGRALGATHEALTAAGYLPAENVQNSRVVDALDRVEQQIADLREEVARYSRAKEQLEAQVPPASASGMPAPHSTSSAGTVAGTRVLPLLDGEAWPEDPAATPDRITLPRWLAADANWAVRVRDGSGTPDLRPGDVALIRRGTSPSGQLVAIVQNGRLVFTTSPGEEVNVGAVVGLLRRLTD
jgi:hypothetical protein